VTGHRQLRIDGREVDHDRVVAQQAPLTAAQGAIIGHIRDHGSIRSVEAGVIVHLHRDRPCTLAGGSRADAYRGTGIACCAYAGTDGLEAMKRLAERGLVERAGIAGRWEPAK